MYDSQPVNEATKGSKTMTASLPGTNTGTQFSETAMSEPAHEAAHMHPQERAPDPLITSTWHHNQALAMHSHCLFLSYSHLPIAHAWCSKLLLQSLFVTGKLKPQTSNLNEHHLPQAPAPEGTPTVFGSAQAAAPPHAALQARASFHPCRRLCTAC